MEEGRGGSEGREEREREKGKGGERGREREGGQRKEGGGRRRKVACTVFSCSDATVRGAAP